MKALKKLPLVASFDVLTTEGAVGGSGGGGYAAGGD